MRFSHRFDDTLPSETLQDNNRLSKTLRIIDQSEQTIPADAIPSDRQPPSRLLRTNIAPITYCGIRFKREAFSPCKLHKINQLQITRVVLLEIMPTNAWVVLSP